ncbi:MAG TPA: hypothetical protein VJ377_08685 [Dehalococcoidales bacterium]|nr:hypothetical protein [Dehalococcoidales bacterium]
MIDIGILAVIIWLGCFVVVGVDSGWRRISPVFWLLAGLFGGPFALLAYGMVRERRG